MFHRLGRLMASRRHQRNISTSHVKRGGDHHDEGGIPGKNLPFDISNRHLLAIYIAGWFGSAFSVPFLLLRHQLKKKNDS